MIHKKRKKNASFRFYSHTQGRFRPFPAVFGLFRPISGLFRPYRQYRPPADTSDMADTARFWPNQPDSVRIEADSARIEPHRRESSRVGANPRKKKKKKNPDAVRRAGNRVERRVPCRATSDAGAAPLVPRPCILGNRVNSPGACMSIISKVSSGVLQGLIILEEKYGVLRCVGRSHSLLSSGFG